MIVGLWRILELIRIVDCAAEIPLFYKLEIVEVILAFSERLRIIKHVGIDTPLRLNAGLVCLILLKKILLSIVLPSCAFESMIS